MTPIPLCVFTAMVCFVSLQTSSAYPMFSVGADKPTPIRYTLRVEQLEFGDPESDEEYPIYVSEEDGEETSDADEEEINYDNEEEEEETCDYNEDEETYDDDDEVEYIVVEEYPGDDEDLEEDESLLPEYYEEYPGPEDNEVEETDLEQNEETQTEDFPERSTAFPDYLYSDYYVTDEGPFNFPYDEDYELEQEEEVSSSDEEIVSLPSINKLHLRKHQKRNVPSHLRILMPTLSRRAEAVRPQKANHPLSFKRRPFNRHHRPPGYMLL